MKMRKYMTEKIVEMKKNAHIAEIFGSFDSNLHTLEEAFGVKISDRSFGETPVISVKGEEDDVQKALLALTHLKDFVERGEELSEQRLLYTISLAQKGAEEELLKAAGKDTLCITAKGKPIKAKTAGQKSYTDTIKNNTVVLGIGPAGTGKTFLAVAMGVTALRQGQVSRLVLTRPAVEAGEKLGYLPGDLQSKIDPYLRPLYDALYQIMGAESFLKNSEKGLIEVAPLAYMRGRTLDNAFIILDEAQNTTPAQMKMFLTRLGFGSKAVITGDITQIDLPTGKTSGLKEAMNVLKGLEDVEICMLDHRDVVRHELVARIIKAYEKHDRDKQARLERKRNFRVKSKD